MRVRNAPPLRKLACGLALLALLVPNVVRAQQAAIRTLDVRPDGVDLEVTVDWPTTLRAALDSVQATTFSAEAVRASTMGLLSTSHVFEMPSLSMPGVRLVASDYEEVALPPGADALRWQQELGESVVEALFPGMLRKQPVATLEARFLRYDATSQRLFRYRRLVVAISFGPQLALSKEGTTSQNPHLLVTRSVLADGTVFKLPIRTEGVYRIDREYLTSLGLNPAAIEPNNLRIFGNGGAPLPARNNAPRIADLRENPVFVRGGGDGSFDAGDVLFFYTRGPQGWAYDAAQNKWNHYTHPFSNDNYVFLKVDNAAGKRIESLPFPATTAQEVSEVEGRYVAEFDEYMWSKEAGSGHTWVSRLIASAASRDLIPSTAMPGLVAGEIRYEAHAALRSLNLFPSPPIRFEVGGASLLETTFGSVGSFADSPEALSRVLSFSQQHAGAPFTLSARFAPNRPGLDLRVASAAVDWVRAFYRQKLEAQGNVLRFSTPRREVGSFEFVMTGFTAEPQVWDVTDPTTPKRLGAVQRAGGWRVQVTADASQPREIIAFAEAAVRRVETRGRRVPGQNLHGVTAFPDLAIVVPDTFRVQAEELAALRRAEGLTVEIASVEAIYNEFSGGLPDMRAVRDWFKFLYDRAPGDASRLRYGLLFGDGHFDFRGLDRDMTLKNWIFPYETENTFDPVLSYTSDDYFGLLDDHEGEWGYYNTSERVDIGIGRLPVQNRAEARAVVAKIKRYESPETFGPWRSQYMFAADDGPRGAAASATDDDLHTQNSDVIAELVKRESPLINVRKVYGLSYERVYLTKWRIPEARQAILAGINDGLLIFNYSGHGNPETLADEDLFTKADAASLTNLDRLPIFITATCSFGRWDKGHDQSAAEVALLNDRGGSIAMFTTVRLVYTSGDTLSANPGLNRRLNEALLSQTPDGLPVRLGDAIWQTKQAAAGLEANGRKFNLLGDPSMRIGLPSYDVRVERLNGKSLDERAQIRALERVTVEGTVRRPDGTPAADFNGNVNLTVYDAERRVPLPYRRYMLTPYYLVREDLIWRGEVQAQGGSFRATFVVPKDISYSNQPGRISAYGTSGGKHGGGFAQNFVVGGTVPDLPNDQLGPDIRLFLGDTTFVGGSLVPAAPELIVRLFDESGINTVGAGVGHEMLLVMNGEEAKAVDIGSLFRADQDSYQRGEVRYKLPEQPSGPGTLSVRAWDVLNNASEATIDYVVSPDAALDVRRVLNFPNPMVDGTRFVFEHNQPIGTSARVQVRVYTLNGQPVRTLDEIETLPAGVLSNGRVQIAWDGRDDDGDRLAPGVYLYKVRVEVEREGGREVAERIERLAVVR